MPGIQINPYHMLQCLRNISISRFRQINCRDLCAPRCILTSTIKRSKGALRIICMPADSSLDVRYFDPKGRPQVYPLTIINASIVRSHRTRVLMRLFCQATGFVLVVRSLPSLHLRTVLLRQRYRLSCGRGRKTMRNKDVARTSFV